MLKLWNWLEIWWSWFFHSNLRPIPSTNMQLSYLSHRELCLARAVLAFLQYPLFEHFCRAELDLSVSWPARSFPTRQNTIDLLSTLDGCFTTLRPGNRCRRPPVIGVVIRAGHLRLFSNFSIMKNMLVFAFSITWIWPIWLYFNRPSPEMAFVIVKLAWK